jgi:hypothetical protein
VKKMPLKGFMLAWLTVLLIVAAWVWEGLRLLPAHPFAAEVMNLATTAAVFGWVVKTEKGPKDHE